MMSRSLRLLLLLACVTCPEVVGDIFMRPSCANGWFHYKSNCYGYFRKLRNWSDAERECQSYGNEAHLVSIQNPEEASAIADYIRGYQRSHPVWIGLHDAQKRKIWQWCDGSKYMYRPWSDMSLGEGEDEDSHCAELSYRHKFLSWNKNNCSKLNHFLCKYQL